ncbi:hypothetical protein [Serinicoccus kebangsaanensis]|uniref:hypothetical protein n=1 Tax=Serinicoccus kebangsaanensis TaxID=2602069 RepID=UPI00124CD51C|nr:hypothetical protein [Serinicoccus kebangsaanensis]
MQDFTSSEVLVPGGRWGWLELVPPLVATTVAVMQAVDTQGDAVWWWILAAAGLVYSVALLTVTLTQLSRRSDTAVRVDGYGMQLPGHGPVPWSQVEDVTTARGDKQAKAWWVVLRDGTRVRTGFRARDRQLRQRWEQARRGQGQGR